MKCAWWAIVKRHPPRPCGALAVGKREGVLVCKKHLHSNPTAVAAVANTIRRTLDDTSMSTEERATTLRRLVEALETPL